jgi:U3 small nucleolar RNA-associated protein 12
MRPEATNFGDFHQSLFAHEDSVMAVKFVPRTHYFFSAGKLTLLRLIY